MLRKFSVFTLSLFAAAVMVGCSQPSQLAPTEDTMSNGTMMEDTTMEEDAMMEEDEAMEEDTMEDTMMEEDDTAMTTGEVQEFTVEGENFSFTPNTMTVNEGDTVRVTFRNVGGSHDFVINEFDVSSGITETGDEVVVEFVADQQGSFEYYCSVGRHREMGMFGTLIVQ